MPVRPSVLFLLALALAPSCSAPDRSRRPVHVTVPLAGSDCQRECQRQEDVCRVGPDEPGCSDDSYGRCLSRCQAAQVSEAPGRTNPHANWLAVIIATAVVAAIAVVVALR